MDTHGLLKHINDGRDEREELQHVIVTLLGRFKGEHQEAYHKTPLASETTTGIQIRRWVELLVRVLQREGQGHGPAFCTKDGEVMESRIIQTEVLGFLKQIQENDREQKLIPDDVDVEEEYRISHLF